MNRVAAKSKPRKRTVKLRTNGKHKIDAASTVKAPLGFPLSRILRPQAAFRWLMPNIAAITPQYIEQTLTGAMTGNHVQQWSLFDLMLKSWPELLACYTELVHGVLRKKLIYEPYCEEDEKPSDSALERMKVVSTALRRMEPEPTRDDSAIEGTIQDILDAWFRGLSISEILWQTIDDAQLGTIAAPKSTFSVDPTNYAFSATGVLGLRPEKETQGNAIWPYVTTSTQPNPARLQPFPDYKFLIAMHKSSSGSVLTGPLLRPLAWWWCAANFSSDWLLNLAQVFGLPFRWANYDPNASPELIDKICSMLQNMGSAGWAAFPTPTTLEMLTTNTQGSDHSPQGELLDRADRYARLLILGQTMTGTHGTMGKGGGQAFGEVEADVKSDRIDAAGRFAEDIINRQLVTSILMLNYGDMQEPPRVRFLEDEEAGLDEAQRDKTLTDAGLEIGVDFLRKKYGIPEPADDEETIGGAPKLPPGFGGALDFQPNENQPPEEPAKAGDAPGHAFRGNQYVTLGAMVETPHGQGIVVATDFNHAWVSVNGQIRAYKREQLVKIPKDTSKFPSILQSEEDKRRLALNTKLEKLNEIEDDAVFASELQKLAEDTHAS